MLMSFPALMVVFPLVVELSLRVFFVEVTSAARFVKSLAELMAIEPPLRVAV